MALADDGPFQVVAIGYRQQGSRGIVDVGSQVPGIACERARERDPLCHEWLFKAWEEDETDKGPVGYTTAIHLIGIASLSSTGCDHMLLSMLKDDRLLRTGRLQSLMLKFHGALVDRECLPLPIYNAFAIATDWRSGRLLRDAVVTGMRTQQGYLEMY